jgi:hypothetical protein
VRWPPEAAASRPDPAHVDRRPRPLRPGHRHHRVPGHPGPVLLTSSPWFVTSAPLHAWLFNFYEGMESNAGLETGTYQVRCVQSTDGTGARLPDRRRTGHRPRHRLDLAAGPLGDDHAGPGRPLVLRRPRPRRELLAPADLCGQSSRAFLVRQWEQKSPLPCLRATAGAVFDSLSARWRRLLNGLGRHPCRRRGAAAPPTRIKPGPGVMDAAPGPGWIWAFLRLGLPDGYSRFHCWLLPPLQSQIST